MCKVYAKSIYVKYLRNENKGKYRSPSHKRKRTVHRANFQNGAPPTCESLPNHLKLLVSKIELRRAFATFHR